MLKFNINDATLRLTGNTVEEFYHHVHFTLPEICVFLGSESMAAMLLCDACGYFCFNEDFLSACFSK